MNAQPLQRNQLKPFLHEYSRSMPLMYRTKVANRHIIGSFHLVLDSVPYGARLFDIGCGTGALLYLAIKLKDVTLAHGYDLSKEAVAASEGVSIAIPELRVTHSADVFPPKDIANYDVVTMVDVLHHIAGPMQDSFVIRLTKTLSPGTLLILSDMEGTNLFTGITARVHDLLVNKQVVRPRKSSDVIAMLADNGLQILSVSWCWSVVFKSFVITARKT
ncbi:MAG: class I SAM-dependent methyltransferase [Nitrospirae bacterium]|uniref:class I SAM-dependent methyltransferase n=1 Tax=Candidatus Magnetobacterium casense TaxID=1455061 RepID=UPI00058EC471|nr:class I SAM-dependent methyltransferase [Candidatus Magnetobacterium casensis]MBF0338480.1 class I SAM-dependent methyltransferase [Nitrospirota bacterium]